MPQFFKRIFCENPFRREPDVSQVQRSRRVLVRNSTGMLGEHSHWRLLPFDAAPDPEETVALRDGGSVAGSSAERPILSRSQEQLPMRKQSRVRRRLSKKHRRPA
ncbi:hypothetical protein EJ02DRAFT_457616 [Clathrospora elynae]|uniref:Uncharacterized protein n=1 Tax=Clathrospora elynae TaxID=706981 RepID=A0A6A5SGJ7_9PLEO|nr:hypothetical protein EJ02DRAFT_457616 [Clathrospora elynae]